MVDFSDYLNSWNSHSDIDISVSTAYGNPRFWAITVIIAIIAIGVAAYTVKVIADINPIDYLKTFSGKVNVVIAWCVIAIFALILTGLNIAYFSSYTSEAFEPVSFTAKVESVYGISNLKCKNQNYYGNTYYDSCDATFTPNDSSRLNYKDARYLLNGKYEEGTFVVDGNKLGLTNRAGDYLKSNSDK